MWEFWVAIGFTIGFSALAVVFFTGRGSFLLAGYNTASDEDKKQYDEKKLCKLAGWVMLYTAVMFLVLGIGAYFFERTVFKTTVLCLSLGLIVLCVIIIILGNTICKKK